MWYFSKKTIGILWKKEQEYSQKCGNVVNNGFLKMLINLQQNN